MSNMSALHRLQATASTKTSTAGLMDSLRDGLASALGGLKEVTVRTPGKYNAYVFVATHGKLNTVSKTLKGLDFSVVKLDTQKVTTGTRMETDGQTTYVQYLAASGLLVISTTLDSLKV